MTRQRSSQRLLARLRGDLPVLFIPLDADLRRTRAGPHQRAQGAWSWYVVHGERELAIGSQYPVADLLRADDLDAYRFEGDWHITPNNRKAEPPMSTETAPPTAVNGNVVLATVRRASKRVVRDQAALDRRKADRDEAIRVAVEAGIGTRTVAEAAGLSNTGVRKILGLDRS